MKYTTYRLLYGAISFLVIGAMFFLLPKELTVLIFMFLGGWKLGEIAEFLAYKSHEKFGDGSHD